MYNLKSWPFLEAHRILKQVGDKETIILETGYGPSGPPHIGTFAEVARTTMVMNALRQLTSKPIKLIVFSDDMDGLRKVPENVPNQEMLGCFINHPLTSVPDPFEVHESFAHSNNAQLRSFLDQYGFEYEFRSSTEQYKSGVFNDTLMLIADYANEIKDIVTRGYKQERRDSYCPFLPIEDGVVHTEVYRWRKVSSYLLEWRDADGNEHLTSMLDGHCKLQWKVDWPMRWLALGVDYEMHGKDLIDSAQIGQRICKLLGRHGPINFMYELFLDENGEKISKSRGNGLDIAEWWNYSSREALSYYMFQNPRKARKLHFDIIPQSTDEYIKSLNRYHTEPDMDNVVWHIHGGDVPHNSSPIAFSMLLNLVSITNTDDTNLIWKYIRNYMPNVTPEDYPILDSLVISAVNYYKHRVLPFKNYREPTNWERHALAMLKNAIREIDSNSETIEEDLTTAIYEIGKKSYGNDKLRDFFQMVYEVLMGQSSGPRLPIFVMLYGIENTAKAIEEKI
jgi:lysyl-tRNA synthetase class 1